MASFWGGTLYKLRNLDGNTTLAQMMAEQQIWKAHPGGWWPCGCAPHRGSPAAAANSPAAETACLATQPLPVGTAERSPASPANNRLKLFLSVLNSGQGVLWDQIGTKINIQMHKVGPCLLKKGRQLGWHI